jgi:hypothetical protein
MQGHQYYIDDAVITFVPTPVNDPPANNDTLGATPEYLPLKVNH